VLEIGRFSDKIRSLEQ